MKRIISKVVLVTLLTMALATLGVLPLFASEQYQIIDLGTLDGTETEAHLINNRGQVVGGSTLEGEYGPHAFLWEDGVITDLGTLGGDYSYPTAINNRGQVVGHSGSHAFLWEDGVMTDLGILGGRYILYSFAYAINERG
jgi:probable HAF family extracellular repeat protein